MENHNGVLNMRDDVLRVERKRQEHLAPELVSEITQLRAELAEERELADALVAAINSAPFDYANWDAEDEQMMEEALASQAKRRKK